MDAVQDLSVIREMKDATGHAFVFNQMAGGKSPACSLRELEEAGVTLVVYSTPCLFPAQRAVERAMQDLVSFSPAAR